MDQADTSIVSINDTIFDRAIEDSQVAPEIRQHASDVLSKDEGEEYSNEPRTSRDPHSCLSMYMTILIPYPQYQWMSGVRAQQNGNCWRAFAV